MNININMNGNINSNMNCIINNDMNMNWNINNDMSNNMICNIIFINYSLIFINNNMNKCSQRYYWLAVDCHAVLSVSREESAATE